MFEQYNRAPSLRGRTATAQLKHLPPAVVQLLARLTGLEQQLRIGARNAAVAEATAVKSMLPPSAGSGIVSAKDAAAVPDTDPIGAAAGLGSGAVGTAGVSSVGGLGAEGDPFLDLLGLDALDALDGAGEIDWEEANSLVGSLDSVFGDGPFAFGPGCSNLGDDEGALPLLPMSSPARAMPLSIPSASAVELADAPPIPPAAVAPAAVEGTVPSLLHSNYYMGQKGVALCKIAPGQPLHLAPVMKKLMQLLRRQRQEIPLTAIVRYTRTLVTTG